MQLITQLRGTDFLGRFWKQRDHESCMFYDQTWTQVLCSWDGVYTSFKSNLLLFLTILCILLLFSLNTDLICLEYLSQLVSKNKFTFPLEIQQRWDMLDFPFCFFYFQFGVPLFTLMLNLLVLENPFYLSKSYSLAMNLRTLWGDCIKPLLFLYCPLKKHLWLNGKGNYLILLSWRYWTQ